MAGGVGGFIAGASVLGLTGTAATVVAIAINTALYVGLTYASSRLAKQDLDSGFQPREILTRSASQPKIVVYGEAMVAGLVFYTNQKPITGDQNFELWVGVVHAGHECEQVGDKILYENDLLEEGSEITWSSNVATVDSGPWHADDATHEAATIYRFLGTSTQSLPTAFTDAFTELSSSHRLRGYAGTIHKFQVFDESEETFKGNQPQNIRALVKGRKCYDPRLDSTQTGGSGSHRADTPSTWEWSDNPILCAANYLMVYWAPVPFPPSRFDWEFIMAEADRCDVSCDIPGGGTQKRYVCNGAISLGEANDASLKKILDCCLGKRYTVNGLVRLRAGGSRTADFTIEESEILRSPGPVVRPALPREERYNKVVGTYFGEDHNWVETEFIAVENAGFVARDNGEEITDELTLEMHVNEFASQRLAFYHLNQSDQQLTCELPLKWSGMRLTSGTYCAVNYSKFGWSGKLFRCLSVKIGVGGVPVTAVLREDSSSAWTDPVEGDYSTRDAQGVIIPADPVVPPPTSMTATAQFQGIQVAWVNPAGRESFEYVDVYASPDSAWANATKVATGVRSESWFHRLDAGTERYYWVRAVRNGVESLREPNSDTSDRNATVSDDPVGAADLASQLPGSIRAGVGSTNIIFHENRDAALSSDPGNFGVSTGVYLFPYSATASFVLVEREISAACEIYTPYAGVAPAQGWFGIVWGATNPVTRFGGSTGDYGDATAEAEGLFCWRYHRSTLIGNSKHYAIRGDGTEVEFTPVDSDLVMGLGYKPSASGGITRFNMLVPSVSDPYSSDSVSGKARGDGRNPGFDIVDWRNDRPAFWFASGDSAASYTYDTHNPDTVILDSSDGTHLYEIARSVDRKQRWRVTMRCRGIGGTANFDIRLLAKDSEMVVGASSLSDQNVVSGGIDVSGVYEADSAGGLTQGTSYGIHTATLECGASAKWVVLGFGMDSSSFDLEVDYFVVQPIISADLGASLLDEDGNVLVGVDVTNDSILGTVLGGGSLLLNPTMDFARRKVGSAALRPIGWFIRGNDEDEVAYSNATRDTIDLTQSGGSALSLISNAMPIEDRDSYQLVVVMRSDNSDNISVGLTEHTAVPSAGKAALFYTTGATFTDSEIQTSTGSQQNLANQAITGTMAEYTFTYEPTDGTKYASVYITLGSGEHCEIDSIWMRPRSTRNTSDLRAAFVALDTTEAFVGTPEYLTDWTLIAGDCPLTKNGDDQTFEMDEPGRYLIKGEFTVSVSDNGIARVSLLKDSSIGYQTVRQWEVENNTATGAKQNFTLSTVAYVEANGDAYDNFRWEIEVVSGGVSASILATFSSTGEIATWFEVTRTNQQPDIAV